MGAQPQGASASIQKVKNRRTDDDAQWTLIASGPQGAPLGAVQPQNKLLAENSRGGKDLVKKFDKSGISDKQK